MRPLPFIAFILLSLLSGAALSCAPADDFSITLVRGPCPLYSVTILGNGSILFEGLVVRVTGVREYTIPPSDVHKLLQKLRDEDFLHWTEKTKGCLDGPEVRITATLNGNHKQVLEVCNEPGRVLELAEELDRISGSKRWVGNVRQICDR